MRGNARLFVVAFAGVVVAACGGGGGGNGGNGGGGTVATTGTTPGAFVITISGMRFSPVNLSVPPGATVTVVNDDGMAHSVTSEPSAGAFTRGGVAGISFDTGDFSSGQKTFQIPASAAAGTVIPYYCTTHLSTMVTPNGSITVTPAAQSTPTPTPSPTSAPAAPPAPGY